MVVLKRVCEDVNHIANLKSLLKFYSNNPNNWESEWSVNPYYMVDLKHYGAGNCMCGHAIRYQFQFLNTVNGKTFPVGSTCVTLLDLPKFSDAIDRLERINQMATQDLDTSLNPVEFVKAYRKFYNLENIEALLSYHQYTPKPYDYSLYQTYFKKRNLSDYVAGKMKNFILDVYEASKKFIGGIERNSKPVTQSQVRDMIDDSSQEMLKFATAKQNKLPF